MILGGLWFIGRESPRTTYHHRPWLWQDGLSLASSFVVLLACLIPLAGLGSQALDYEPYPTLSLPAFNTQLGILMLGLVIPGLLSIKLGAETRLQRDSVKEGHHA